jgi:hypothetical protein
MIAIKYGLLDAHAHTLTPLHKNDRKPSIDAYRLCFVVFCYFYYFYIKYIQWTLCTRVIQKSHKNFA